MSKQVKFPIFHMSFDSKMPSCQSNLMITVLGFVTKGVTKHNFHSKVIRNIFITKYSCHAHNSISMVMMNGDQNVLHWHIIWVLNHSVTGKYAMPGMPVACFHGIPWYPWGWGLDCHGANKQVVNTDYIYWQPNVSQFLTFFWKKLRIWAFRNYM